MNRAFKSVLRYLLQQHCTCNDRHCVVLGSLQHGDVSAYSYNGDVLWTRNYGTHWGTDDDDNNGITEQGAVTFTPVAMWTHAIPTAVLAVGDRHLAVISEHGNLLADMELQGRPVQPVQVKAWATYLLSS